MSRKRNRNIPSISPNAKRQRTLTDSSDDDNDNNNTNTVIKSENQHTSHYDRWTSFISQIQPDYTPDLAMMSDSGTSSNTNNSSSLSNTSILAHNNIKLKSEIKELREKLKILKNLVTNRSPNTKLVQLDKLAPVPISKGLRLIQERKMIYNPNIIRIIMGVNVHNTHYKEAVKHFLEKNDNFHCIENNMTNPYIVVKKIKKKNPVRLKLKYKKQRQILKLKDENVGPSSSRTSLKKLLTNVKVIVLEQIPKNTVIGEYYGFSFTADEFENYYCGSAHEYLANYYCLEEDIDVDEIEQEMKQQFVNHNDNDNNDNNNHHNRNSSAVNETEIDDDDDDDDEDTEDDDGDIDREVTVDVDDELLSKTVKSIKEYGEKFIIDAFGYQSFTKKDHLLLYTANKDDHNEANVDYIHCVVNGWPRIFVITKRKLKKNEILIADFGAKSTKASAKADTYEMLQAIVASKIDDILSMDLMLT